MKIALQNILNSRVVFLFVREASLPVLDRDGKPCCLESWLSKFSPYRLLFYETVSVR